MSLSDLIFSLLAWVVIHLSIGFGCSIIPNSWFDRRGPLYRTYGWEAGGQLYEKIFRVRAWKRLLPNGGALYPNSYNLQRLDSSEPASLEYWLRESCRAEFCHWLMIPPGFLFFMWSGFLFGLGMVAYALLNNLFPIVVQRYNRPRVQDLLRRIEDKPVQEQVRQEVALAGNS